MSITLFGLLKATHVVAAIWLMGPAFGYGIISAMGHEQTQHRGFAVQVMGRLSKRMFYPGIVVVIASGLGMGIIVPAFYTQGWLIISLVIVAGLLIYSFTFQRSHRQEVGQLMRTLAGGSDPAAIARLDVLRTRMHIGGRFTAYGYGLVAILMVLRPF